MPFMSSKNSDLYKIVVLGDGGVGKTALTIQLCLNHFVETYDPTIEDSYRKQVEIDHVTCTLEILDTAGQEEYTNLLDQWLRDMDGYIVVYSITSKSSFENVDKWVGRIYHACGGRPSPFSNNVNPELEAEHADKFPIPIVLVGNKSDRSAEREVQKDEAIKLAKKLYSNSKLVDGKDKDKQDIRFHEASAKNRIGVDEAFYDVVREIRRQRKQKTGPLGLKLPGASTTSPNDSPIKGGGKRKIVMPKPCVMM